mmetsp:Transcript_60797/g.168563  ORF Transcript_60797/g.168563 Transcript_60797/m.168563 type:complete len:129 (-) Transcript_60797:839-1225(-)
MLENDLEGTRSRPVSDGGGSTAADVGGGALEATGMEALPRVMLFRRKGECDIVCHGDMFTVGVAEPCGALFSLRGTALPGGYAGLPVPGAAARRRAGDCDLWAAALAAVAAAVRGVMPPCGVVLRGIW